MRVFGEEPAGVEVGGGDVPEPQACGVLIYEPVDQHLPRQKSTIITQ